MAELWTLDAQDPMKHLRFCLAFVFLCTCCSKPPRLAEFTQGDVTRELTNGISRQVVEQLFGAPVVDMEFDDVRYMLRYTSPHPRADFQGFDAFFEKDRLTHWRPWKPGEP